MSAFYITCPTCKQVYYYCFVGNRLVSGHKCPGPQRPKMPSPWDDTPGTKAGL